MKRPSPFIRNRESMSTDQAMTSMIDVIFLLLVFFVCTTSFQIIEQLLPSQMSSLTGSEVENPDPPPPEENDFDRVVIRIGWDGTAPTWQINGANIPSIDQIREQLAALADIKIDAPLVLHPDPNVPLGFVITAYDEAKLAGFPKVSFAVNAQGK